MVTTTTTTTTKQSQTKRCVIKPYRLKLACTIPSALLQGFSNYLATILTKLPQRYTVLYQHIRFIVCCSYVSFVCILCFYPVALSIVVFCCFPLVAVGDILSASAYFWAVFSVWGFVPPLVFRRWPHFVEVLSSCSIKALSSYFILRLRPHILFWGFGLVLYWGFVLIF